MRKLWLFAALAMLLLNQLHSQTLSADSLRRLLQQRIPDTSRSDYLSQLAFNLVTTDRDSALLLAREGLAIANQLGYVRGQAANLHSIASVFLNTGDHAKALNMYLDVLKQYESVGGDQRMIAVLINLGYLYANLFDYRKSQEYTTKARIMAEQYHDLRRLTSIYLNLGDVFEKDNQLDSARLYSTMAHELAIKTGRQAHVAIALGNLGNIYRKRKEYDLALSHYRLAIRELTAMAGDPVSPCEFYIGMARTFNELNQPDSSLCYARQSYLLAAASDIPREVLDASDYLYQLFKMTGRYDSAFYYREVSIAAKDSIYSEEKERAIQRLTFDEQVRQT
jgi:tetratricopeptide (TPR) repeat protein